MVTKNIENNNKNALKSAVWYTIASILSRCTAFFTIPIFTRLLSKNEFGQFNNYNSWVQILAIIITLDVHATLISAKYDYEKDFDKYILTAFSLSSISTFIWAIILNIFGDFFSTFFSLDIYYINCMIVYLIFYSAFSLFQTRARVLFKYKWNVLLSVSNAFFTALCAVVLVLTMKDRLKGRILGAIIPTIVIGFGNVIYFVKKGKKIDPSYWKYILKVGLPYIPHALSLVLLASIDRIMITKMCGNEQTALYSLAYNCGLLIMLFVSSLNDAYAPWLGDMLNKNKFEDIRRFSKRYIIVFLVLAIGVMLIIPEVLLVLGGKAYLEAKFVLAPVALSCIYQFFYTMFVNVEQIKKKTGYMALASISAAVINYILNLIFLPRFGYISAAYTTVVGYIWLLGIHMIIVYKIGYGKAYDYKFIIMSTIFALLITLLISCLYLNLAIRYVFIGVYIILILIIAVRYKDLILDFIKKLKRKE